jgi:GNAT superfamily N-acetyltransferase
MGAISYEYKHASAVTKDEETYLKKLRIPDIGLIWDDYRAHRKNRRCWVVLAKVSRGHPIAWGLIYWDSVEKEWVFSVFVKRTYRRRGIGRRLYDIVKKKRRIVDLQIHVYRHDDTSILFFNKVQK